MAKILVAGATGFIGSRTVDYFLGKGHAVRALVRRESPRISKLDGKKAEIVFGDLAAPETLEAACAGQQVVINCSGLVSDWVPKKEFHRINVEGVGHLCEAAVRAGVARFVHLSTNDVFGLTENAVIDESFPLRKWHEPYPDSKAAGEKILWKYHRVRGLPISVLYPCWVYGEGDTTFLPLLADAIVKGEFIYWRKNSHVWPCYIGNLLDLVERAAFDKKAIGKGFLVHDNTLLYFRHFVRLIARSLGVRVPSLRIPYPLAYSIAGACELFYKLAVISNRPLLTTYTVKNFGSRLVFSMERATQELGFIPPFSFKEGFERAIGWLRQSLPPLPRRIGRAVSLL
jgi:nucleoside-diphosphate-sugar epimerase